MDPVPSVLSPQQVAKLFEGGPSPKGATMLLLGERIYKNEGGVWRLLDDRTYASVREMADAAEPE
jgi:hypothetical protein